MVAEVLEDDFLPASVSWNSLIMVMNLELSSLLEAAPIKVSRSSMDFRMEREAVVPLILTGPVGAVVVIFMKRNSIVQGWGVLSADALPPVPTIYQCQTTTVQILLYKISF